MSRRKVGSENVRKIIRMGSHSMGITLPIEFLSKLGWRQKQKVVVKRVGGKLVISDWKN